MVRRPIESSEYPEASEDEAIEEELYALFDLSALQEGAGLTLGNDREASAAFEGIIQEARLFAHPRSQDQLATDSVRYIACSEARVALWTLNEAGGTVATEVRRHKLRFLGD
eukprot:scaffold9640_cov36-Prasinocladus_malaysianus.AAC.1